MCKSKECLAVQEGAVGRTAVVLRAAKPVWFRDCSALLGWECATVLPVASSMSCTMGSSPATVDCTCDKLALVRHKDEGGQRATCPSQQQFVVTQVKSKALSARMPDCGVCLPAMHARAVSKASSPPPAASPW